MITEPDFTKQYKSMNTQKLLDPEVGEIARSYKEFIEKYPNLPGFGELSAWDTFVQQHTRKPIFKTCVEDGEQDVFEGDEYFFLRNGHIGLHSNICLIGAGAQKDVLYFKSRENAVTYLCKNYKFTVEEIIVIRDDWERLPDFVKDSFKAHFTNEAKKRLNL